MAWIGVNRILNKVSNSELLFYKFCKFVCNIVCVSLLLSSPATSFLCQASIEPLLSIERVHRPNVWQFSQRHSHAPTRWPRWKWVFPRCSCSFLCHLSFLWLRVCSQNKQFVTTSEREAVCVRRWTRKRPRKSSRNVAFKSEFRRRRIPFSSLTFNLIESLSHDGLWNLPSRVLKRNRVRTKAGVHVIPSQRFLFWYQNQITEKWNSHSGANPERVHSGWCSFVIHMKVLFVILRFVTVHKSALGYSATKKFQQIQRP